MLNQKLINYTKKILAQNRNKKETKDILLKEGWPENEITEALLSTEDYPKVVVSKKPKVKALNIESIFKQPKNIMIFTIGAVSIFALVFFCWQYFFKESVIKAEFELTASMSDSAGVDPMTTFVLKSSEDLSHRTVQKILSFKPEIDFKVKKIDGGFLGNKIFKKVLAQANDEESNVSSFEIKPEQPLRTDVIYTVVISEEFAEREYSWAYQVKAPFQVISAHPGDKSASVPINSGIEIVFNREEFVNPEKYFSITPKTDGRFEINGNMLVFLPNKLEEATVYTITIKKGLDINGSDDVLDKDYTFRFETGLEHYSNRGYYFNFQNDLLDFIPNQKPIFKFSSYGLGIDQLKFSVYKLSDVNEFLSSYQNSREWSLGWAYYYRRQANSLYQPEQGTEIISFNAEPIKVGYEQFIEVPQELEQGYYLVDAKYRDGSNNEKHRQAWLQITPLAHYFSITNNQSLLWVNDFEKKIAVGNTKITYIEKTDKIDLGNTDAKGLLQFATPENLKNQDRKEISEPQFFQIEHSQYPTTIIKIADSWGYYREVNQGDLYWDYISTDRYTYQMNDTLRYWGVIKGRSENLRQKKVTIGVYQGWQGPWDGGVAEDKALIMQEVVVSSFDTIQGQLQFNGLTPGFYYIAAILDGKVISESSIQILTYSKPAYQIIVTPSENTIFADEQVDFKIEASFFDGTPVSDLQLQYNGYWHNSLIKGELSLDKFGQGKFSYTPNYYESGYWPRSLNISFSPKMSEEGEIFGSGRALVFGPDIYLQSYQSEESDNTYKFTTKLNNIVLDNAEDTSGIFREEYIGSPVKNYPVLAKIIKITYRKIEVGEYYDYINKIVQKKYNYKREEEIVESINGTTDINGEWSFSRNFSKEENSTYRIDFISHDSQDKNIKNSTYVWRSPYTHWKDFQVSLNINGNSYHEEFSNGDKINLDLQIVEGEKPDNLKTLFYRYQNNIDKTNIVSSLDYEEIFEGAFAPSVQYRAVVLGPYGFEESNSVTASFNETDNKLSINIEQDKEKYRPGEQINLNLNVKDQRNQGVISEVNVAVVDEALFHVLPYDYYRKDILSNLYRDIWTNPLTHASQYDFLGASGAEGGGCFTEGTKILMWDGSLKNIEDVKVGDQILTRSDSQNNELDIAITQGVSQHFVRKYLIINDFLGVTPEHRLYVNNDWVYAGNIQIGDELLNQDGEIIIVESMETREGLVPVYNIIVNEYHTYFADGFYVHNGEKGGQARVHFVDTAFFDTVSTDRHGDSSIYFMAPDNITSWRVTAQAFATESLKAGQNIKLVKTSLPFFVDVSLNNFYLVGDSPILRVRAFGEELSQTAGVEFEVKSESLGIDEKVNSSNNFAYIPLGNLSEGEHEIIISGKQGGNKDAIIRKISVVRSYFKKSASSFYKLSDGLSNIEGNKDGFTKIKFMDLGRGRLYRALLSHKYNSGIRADQVVAKYLSKKYLLDCFDGPWVEQSLDLSGYHLKNDGLGLFPYGGEDLALTAKLSDLVPEFIFKGNVKNYLRSSLVNDKADIHRISKALYGLASLDELVLTKINLVKDDPALNIEDRIYLALGLTKLGDKEGARKIYYNQIRNELRFQGQEAWLHNENDMTKRVKLTGLIAVLASYLNEEDAQVLGEYMLTHNPEKDLDSLEELLYIKSELAKPEDNEIEFKYQTNVRSDLIVLEKGRSYELTLPYTELQSIEFGSVKGNIALVSSYERSENPEDLNKNAELSLERTYLVNSQQTNLLNEGDVVLIRLDPKIAQNAIDGMYQLIDYLPSGLKPITQLYSQGLSRGTTCNPIWHPSIIENNVVYFNIWKGFNSNNYCSNRTVNYYARVVSAGSYKSNPAVIQSLKDLESLNTSSENFLEIK